MAINVEWIINKSKQKIYAVTHAKAVVRGTSTVDFDLQQMENALEEFETEVIALRDDVEDLDLSAIEFHLVAAISSETGAHGFRYWEETLQFHNGTSWIDIATGSPGVPPTSMKSVKAGYGLDATKVVLRGTDPDDIEVEGATLSVWAGTQIVRKVGSYPTKPSDGVLVVDYQTRNQYETSAFIDTGLVAGETYYYRWFPYSDVGAINLSPEGNSASITTKDYTVVGVKAEWNNNTFTRLESAIGLSEGTDFNQFDAFGKRRRCIVADDRTILAFHGDTGYSETGKTTQVISQGGTSYPIGTSVQVMVYQPKFYYKVEPVTKVANPGGTGFVIRAAKYYVSDIDYEGFSVHPAFVRNGIELPYILMSAYEASSQNTNNSYVTNGDSLGDRLASIANAKPVSGQATTFTRAVARTKAAARGTGWQIGDFLMASVSQLLFTVEYAGMNCQTELGKGNVDSESDYLDVVNTGGTSSLGNSSGDASGTVGKRCVSYRGEENLWGNLWTWQDGLNCYNSSQGVAYWADSNFSDSTSAAPYQSTGFNFARENGYISAYGYSADCDWAFIPCEVTGDTAEPVGDFLYQSYTNTSMTVAKLGGSCVSGLGAGLFYWSLDNVPSTSYWYVGSRLGCIPSADAVPQ